jgi:hypothetical protein
VPPSTLLESFVPNASPSPPYLPLSRCCFPGSRGYINFDRWQAWSILIFAFVVMFAYNLLFGKYNMAPDSYIMVLAAAAGFWGAAFSMLTGLKTRIEASALEDLKLARYIALLLARALVGVGAALILYFFLRSGLLSGTAFPDLSMCDSKTLKGYCNGKPEYDVWKTWAILIVWCFLAGFSEKLVPSLLAKTEGRLSESPQQEPRSAAPAPGSKPATNGSNGQASGEKTSQAKATEGASHSGAGTTRGSAA